MYVVICGDLDAKHIRNMAKIKRYINNIDSVKEKFLLDHYRKEWALAEADLKKHELAQKVKEGVLKSGELALTVLMAGGVLTLGLIAPKVLVAFHRTGRYKRYFQAENIEKKMSEFSSRSYFRYQKIAPQEYSVTITKKGRKLAQKFALQNFKLHLEKAWDGKWRIITFDINRKNSGARDALRLKLRQIGALAIQESVFVFPYDCYKEIIFWASFYRVEKCIYYLEVSKIFNEDHPIETNLKKSFGL